MEWKERIKLNGNEYVLISEAEQACEKIAKDASTVSFMQPGIEKRNAHTDPTFCLGIFSAKLSGTWIRTRITIELFERILTALKAISPEKDYVDFVFSKEMPIMIGTLSEANAEMTGLILAPRSDS